jgi:hypothetical protein
MRSVTQRKRHAGLPAFALDKLTVALVRGVKASQQSLKCVDILPEVPPAAAHASEKAVNFSQDGSVL